MTDTTQPGADNALDLDKLEALLRAATPGPWHAPGMGEIHAENHDDIAQITFHTGDDEDGQCGTEADAVFIAAAKNAMPALIALARRAAQPVDPAVPAVGGEIVATAEPIMFGESPVENMEIGLLCRCLSENTMFDGKGLESAWNQLVAFYVANWSSAAPAGALVAKDEPILQALSDFNDAWHDVDVDLYNRQPADRRRIVYAAQTGSAAAPAGLRAAFELFKNTHGTIYADSTEGYYEAARKVLDFVQAQLATNQPIPTGEKE